MKTTKLLKFLTIAMLFTLNASNIKAQEKATNDMVSDTPIEISLLTCAPHNEVYSLYGHTAIRYQDKVQGVDVAINYGVFSFKKPFFILRFVFGLTDYEIGIQEFEDFCAEYNHYGSKVTEQVLNLTTEEKNTIREAVEKNLLPENRVYRYNYFYNNCTTKARDIILDNVKRHVTYGNRIDNSVSFREIIHSCNEKHPWARFGNDLLLGIEADFATTREYQQFLPANLMRDFAYAKIGNVGTEYAPFVKATNVVVEGNKESDETIDFCPTPIACAIALFVITALTTAMEWLKKKHFWIIDSILLTVCGLAGLILFVMIFSQHPTVRINLQILLLNPLFLYAAWYTARNRRQGNKTRKAWNIIAVFVILALISNTVQHFAEGMQFLALSLLTRWGGVLLRTKNTLSITGINNICTASTKQV